MRLGGIDHVVTVIEPVRHQPLHQVGRMLAVAVHEQHGAEAGVVEPGHERGFLAEIARQRHHLDVERIGRQSLGDAERRIPAAVVDIDHLGCHSPRGAQPAGDLDQPAVERGQVVCLVEHRNDDR